MAEVKGDILRVEYKPQAVRWKVRVEAFETDPAYYGVDSWYENVDKMPQWMQDKLNKLQIMQLPPPIVSIEGIGRRMGENLYWVYVTR